MPGRISVILVQYCFVTCRQYSPMPRFCLRRVVPLILPCPKAMPPTCTVTTHPLATFPRGTCPWCVASYGSRPIHPLNSYNSAPLNGAYISWPYWAMPIVHGSLYVYYRFRKAISSVPKPCHSDCMAILPATAPISYAVNNPVVPALKAMPLIPTRCTQYCVGPGRTNASSNTFVAGS